MNRPQNILDVINQNIVTVSEDIHTLMAEVAKTQQEVIALSLMFKAPEQPSVPGEEGVSEKVGNKNNKSVEL